MGTNGNLTKACLRMALSARLRRGCNEEEETGDSTDTNWTVSATGSMFPGSSLPQSARGCGVVAATGNSRWSAATKPGYKARVARRPDHAPEAVSAGAHPPPPRRAGPLRAGVSGCSFPQTRQVVICAYSHPAKCSHGTDVLHPGQPSSDSTLAQARLLPPQWPGPNGEKTASCRDQDWRIFQNESLRLILF